jgi:hypothetical protein
MWPIQLAIRFLISFRIFLCSLTLNNISSFLTWSVQLIFSILLQHHISKLSSYKYKFKGKGRLFTRCANTEERQWYSSNTFATSLIKSAPRLGCLNPGKTWYP